MRSIDPLPPSCTRTVCICILYMYRGLGGEGERERDVRAAAGCTMGAAVARGS